MKLFQIEPEKIVTVTVKNPKGTVINYKTKAVFGKNDMLFLEPVRQGDKILDFSGESLARYKRFYNVSYCFYNSFY